jgi:hypothetical protein
VQRTSALAATFLRRFFHAQPVSARGTLRIQTLHGPPWKLLHFTSRGAKFGLEQKEESPTVSLRKKIRAP